MEVGFTQILSSFVELFGIIYTSGYMLFTWLSSPITNQAGAFGELLGEFGDFTPLEIMFGSGLILVLIFAFIKFFLGIIK